MANYFSLIKVFLKSIRRESSSNKRTKHVFRLLIFFTLLFAIIPFLVICGSFVYDTTIKLIDIEYESIGLQLVCYIMCLFTFVFGIIALINELFLSTDIEKLMPLPIKPVELAMAKFTTCFVLENIIQIVLAIVCIISYMLALDLSVFNFVVSLIQILTLSIIPMIYSGIICLIIMYFAKFIKNKEHIKKISAFIIVILFVGFILLIDKIKGFDFQLYLENFVNGDHKFLGVMNIIFPHINMFTDTLTNMNIFSLLKYIVINGIYIGIFILLLKAFYYKSVIDLSNKNNSTVKNSTILLKKNKQKGIIRSYLSKELKVLLRTPSFFINQVLINFIWPIIIYAFYEIGTLKYDFSTIKSLIAVNDGKIKLILLLFVVAISIVVTAMNAISATSFSREGKNFQFMKYIPVSYSTQLFVKYLIGFLFAFIGIIIYAIPFFIIIKLDFITSVSLILISVLCISFISLIGLFIDSLQPKLYWDDENNVLRENYNTFISMGVSLLLLIVICIGSYAYLYRKLGYTYNQVFLLILSILLMLNVIMYIVNRSATIKNIIEQE